ncbi:aminodeoxychorismate/anthranilate synthase component II [Maridesulfovibrio zosterae]|uniref:aminodeoxychorismate/anthranilate synthase component II n=1 Tax=Maridesulfovibrio zosterae TaxID=82171 RepID=UPI0003F75B97|nr:aminodeoxychorismate/anthranilate synthase component II [Maridesulfovibrio zosterae]
MNNMKILIIDNNDSFTNNLMHLFAKEISSVEILSKSCDHILSQDFQSSELNGYDLLIISPGPGCPADYPGYEAVIKSGKPVLGVCLGMQIINEYCGGKTSRLKGCFHGRTEKISFAGLQLNVARYHSLFCSEIGDGLEVISENNEGIPMAVSHGSLPLLGYQFHPESFLTEQSGVFIKYAFDFFKFSKF